MKNTLEIMYTLMWIIKNVKYFIAFAYSTYVYDSRESSPYKIYPSSSR